ncbi:SIP domain-containing protein [Sphingomonas sp. S2-65]|uniref:SIP domain-containing protein n=1 Tax=Sphingomonas sp. S2-65 TaxID=2903960 RepID=UPI0039B6F45F
MTNAASSARAHRWTSRACGAPLVIVGDETSIGLVYAATHQDPTRLVSACLTVEDVESARRVAEHLGLLDVALVARRGDDSHFAAMEATLAEAAVDGASLVLTGNAGTIQRLRQGLRPRSFPTGRVITKAYWALGKTGLD